MKRNITLEEITDGKIYGLNDMVKADCLDCRGCSDCCRGMGNTISLDPLDIHRLKRNLNMDFRELMAKCVELSNIDGVMLPNLKMLEGKDRCVFLSGAGRCEIHSARPGICRLFPLGRYYHDRTHSYILQVNECSNKNRSKIKVSKWIDTENLDEFEEYIDNWHFLIRDIQDNIGKFSPSEHQKMNMKLLNLFFVMPFSENEFYSQCSNRIANMRNQFFI